MKQLEYTIKATLFVDADNPEEITDILDTLRGIGTAEIEGVKLIDSKTAK